MLNCQLLYSVPYFTSFSYSASCILGWHFTMKVTRSTANTNRSWQNYKSGSRKWVLQFRVPSIRGNQGKSQENFSSGKSIFFVEGQGKWSFWDEPNFSLIFRHISVKTQLLRISISTLQVCAVRSGKLRKKCPLYVSESRWIQIELTAWKPGYFTCDIIWIYIRLLIKIEKYCTSE